MELVILESPYAGNVSFNVEYAKLCMKDALSRNEAPMVSHLLYTQCLDDNNPIQRELGIQAGYDIAREELRKSPDALKKAVDGSKSADDSVTVLNITVFGSGETKGLVIQGSLRAINGYTTVKCPVIRFNSEAMAIEKSVEAIFEKIREEAYAFLFQNKRKQLSIEEQEQNEEKRKKKLGVSKNQTEIPVE